MKLWFSLLSLLITLSAASQKVQLIPVNHQARETSPHLLAKWLTASATSEKERVTVIFRWITDNIAYNTGIFYKNPRKVPILYPLTETEDTGALAPLNDRVAESVLSKRVAVCDGYARLFASLCHYAGIKAELITGYVRTDRNRTGQKFRSNHSWNAVQIDSAWYLVDATWASGYVTYGSNEFVRSYNPQYFLTQPEEFIKSHYPENLEWTLLAKPPELKEYLWAPFKFRGFITSKIKAFSPGEGVINAAPGDTIKIELETEMKERNLFVTTGAVTDSLLETYFREPVTPAIIIGEKIIYSYVLKEEEGGWLHVIYNNEPILRYKLNFRKTNVTALSTEHQNLK